jgi:hypothetical protein
VPAGTGGQTRERMGKSIAIQRMCPLRRHIP